MASPHLAHDDPSPGSTRRRTPLEVKAGNVSAVVFIPKFRLVTLFT